MDMPSIQRAAHAARPAGAALPALDVEVLLRGQREVRLRHGDQEYRLQLTRNGKLILTK